MASRWNLSVPEMIGHFPTANPSELRVSVGHYGARGHANGGELGNKTAPERVVRKLLDEDPDDPARSAFIDQLLNRRKIKGALNAIST